MKEKFQADPAGWVKDEIKAFVSQSRLGAMPRQKEYRIFDEPLIGFADGDSPIFLKFRTVGSPNHMTPREALAKFLNMEPDDISGRLSVISWILPMNSQTLESMHNQTSVPSQEWVNTRNYGSLLNYTLRTHIVDLLTGMGYLAVAPADHLSLFSYVRDYEKGLLYSNWSQRHVAYAAGLGTFGLSDGFISERGIAHRAGSVVTNLALPANQPVSENPYANCLFYAGVKCGACIERCPVGAITEKGHDKMKCYHYAHGGIRIGNVPVNEYYNVGQAGCGFCQTKVPCEHANPTKTL